MFASGSDALAQQARTRIAQQHAGQHPPSSGHHTPPSTHRQPSGFSYFSQSGHPQPVMIKSLQVGAYVCVYALYAGYAAEDI